MGFLVFLDAKIVKTDSVSFLEGDSAVAPQRQLTTTHLSPRGSTTQAHCSGAHCQARRAGGFPRRLWPSVIDSGRTARGVAPGNALVALRMATGVALSSHGPIHPASSVFNSLATDSVTQSRHYHSSLSTVQADGLDDFQGHP